MAEKDRNEKIYPGPTRCSGKLALTVPGVDG